MTKNADTQMMMMMIMMMMMMLAFDVC